MPFDGQSEHCVVVQDNCAIHHVQEVNDALNDAGVIVQYLPPYSPDYNPIEEGEVYAESNGSGNGIL